MKYNLKLNNNKDIINMINILMDARQYHAIYLHDRLKKNYKQNAKKKYNDKMIKYHENKINEIYKLIHDIENKSKIFE